MPILYSLPKMIVREFLQIKNSQENDTNDKGQMRDNTKIIKDG